MAGTAHDFKLSTSQQLGVAQPIAVQQRNIVVDLETLRTWMAEVDGDLDAINDYLDYSGERDGIVSTDAFDISGSSSAVTLLGAGRISYRIGGVLYEALVDTTITLTDNTAVTQGTNEYKAWRIVIDRLGVITTETRTSATGVLTEQIALLELAGVARAANTIDIGYFVIQAATGNFTPNTTDIDDATVVDTYHVLRTSRQNNGLFAALGSSLIVTTGSAATWAVGTVDAQALGVRLAQISAQTAQALDAADTIADANFGGWLFCVNLAGTDIVSISSDGAPEVSALTDASDAAAVTALDLVADRLPAMFVPIGTIRLENQSSAGFTANTTNWNVAGLTVSTTDFTVGVHDRTVSAATLQARQINPPVIPATVAAPVTASDLVASSITPTK